MNGIYKFCAAAVKRERAMLLAAKADAIQEATRRLAVIDRREALSRECKRYQRLYSLHPGADELPEPAGDVIFSQLVLRVGEDPVCIVHLDEHAEVKVSDPPGHTRGLLHRVGHDHDRVVF
jgi:hypothetical protein